MHTNIIGLILSGGLSTRMGTDKGLICTKENIPWSLLTYNKLSNCGINTYISVRKEQMEKYIPFFSEEKLIIDMEISIQGPLKGMISANTKLNLNQALFIIANDMPNITEEIINKFIKLYDIYLSKYEIYIASTENQFEPLFGIYSRQSLQSMKNIAIKENNFKLQYLLSHFSLYKFNIPKNCLNQFQNYNTPETIRKFII